MRTLGEATEVGLATNEMLEMQGEQIDRIQTSLDKMHTDLDYADRLMKKLASPWGFSGRARHYAKTFERIYGAPAEYSGPMLKRRDFYTSQYRERFFALLGSNLYYFKDALHLKKPMKVLSIEGARVRTIKHQKGEAAQPVSPDGKGKRKTLGKKAKDDVPYEFMLRVSKPTKKEFYFRCSSEREHVGWIASLTRSRSTGCRYEAADGKVGNPCLGPARGTDALDAGASSVNHGDVASGHARSSDRTTLMKKQIDNQIDKNLDSISAMLGNLGEIAREQANAIDVQNAKLDNVEISVDSATARIDRLNYKGAKILR